MRSAWCRTGSVARVSMARRPARERGADSPKGRRGRRTSGRPGTGGSRAGRLATGRDGEDRREFLLKDLLAAVYWLDESLQAHLEASGWPRTSRTKSMILINVADGVTRPIQIAGNLGVSRQAVHLALAELERDGLVRLEPDPDDRRAKRVRFSDDPRGARMRGDALRALARIEGELARRIGPTLHRSLCRALRADRGAPPCP